MGSADLMTTRTILWCLTHDSPIIRDPDTDPDDYWLCAASNLSGDQEPCDVCEAEVTCPSP